MTPEDRRRLTPHPRSVLHFLRFCLQVRETESLTLPVEIDPDIFRIVAETLRLDRGESNAAFHRHRTRATKEFGNVREAVAQDAERLIDTVNQELVDWISGLVWQNRTLRYVLLKQQDTHQGRKRSAATQANMAFDRQLNAAIAGLFVTFGAGEISRTALVAQKGKPRGAQDGVVSYSHVRSRLATYTGPLWSVWNPDRTEVAFATASLAGGLADDIRIAHWAWKLFRASDYSPSNHEARLNSVIDSGDLAQWLHDAENEHDPAFDSQRKRAVEHLESYVIRHQIKMLEKRRRVPLTSKMTA
ncbi:hypothetical protein [Aureimonas frigidaquae]|uniref:hypothetical protein n=1 Tax=Aureimonas frigidaquae TaxID=424757 RepID=UPI000781CCC4|nr:hypothetical protein [Aureimonas frigidaquae]